MTRPHDGCLLCFLVCVCLVACLLVSLLVLACLFRAFACLLALQLSSLLCLCKLTYTIRWTPGGGGGVDHLRFARGLGRDGTAGTVVTSGSVAAHSSS